MTKISRGIIYARTHLSAMNKALKQNSANFKKNYNIRVEAISSAPGSTGLWRFKVWAELKKPRNCVLSNK